MTPAMERDFLSELASAVAAYLSTMAVTADCLEQAFPEVGGPYRTRILSLRARLSFDATRENIAESAQTLKDELKDYARVAKKVQTTRGLELERGILALSDIIENLTQRQEFYAKSLQEFAAQVAKEAYPADAMSFSEVMAKQAASVRRLVEGMNHEAGSMTTKMREQMLEMDRRLASARSTDAATGLINRQELESQIEAHKLQGTVFSLLLFDLNGPISDQVLRMAAAKIAAQFRHRDRIARWGCSQFAVLFLGGNELAETRAQQVIPRVSGHYQLENGETVLIGARVSLLQPELQPA